jgi:hypothetical protein
MEFRDMQMDNLTYVGASLMACPPGRNVADDRIPIILHKLPQEVGMQFKVCS